MRTFIALEIPNKIQKQCTQVIRSLSTILPSNEVPAIRWVTSDRIHLTLRFLGKTDPAIVPELCVALDSIVSQVDPFILNLTTVGVFPGWKSPRVLWLGLETPPELLKLQKSIETEVQNLNFKPDRREFAAHLTLGRIQRNASEASLNKIKNMKNHPLPKFESAKIDTITLFESKLSPSGPVYLPLHAVKLGKFF